MLARLRKSRGWVRFRRNRTANIALWVIGAYFLLSGWIWGMEGVHALGKRTGGWDLADRPILGVFLPEKTLERVGPAQVAGFGIRQSARDRTNHADWLLKFVGAALQDVDRLPADSATTPAEILARARLAERSIAAKPPEQIRAWHAEAGTLFNDIDGIRRITNAVAGVKLREELLLDLLASPPRTDGGTPDAIEFRGNLLNAAEDLLFAIEDARKVVPERDPLQTLDLVPLEDAVEALTDLARSALPTEAAATISRDWVALIDRGDDDRDRAIDQELDSSLLQIEALIDKMLPRPSGFEGALYAFKMVLGTDRQGRSIMIRSLYSAKIAIQVGTVVALVSVLFGAALGSAAAYYGKWVDHAVIWLYSSLSSLPQLVLLAVLSFMFIGSAFEKTLLPVYAAFCLTFWIGPCRVIRGEVLKIRQLEYAQAATAIGFDRPYILLRHVIPNTSHLMFINFSLLFIGAIKSEVILTFLGLGIKEGSSWGIMISQSQPEVVNGFFWQIGAATVFMLILVLAFNVVSDALQDAFDPKHVG